MIEAATERKNLCITLVDLDHFKKFNDRFGHIFGMISEICAEVLRSTMGETRTISSAMAEMNLS